MVLLLALALDNRATTIFSLRVIGHEKRLNKRGVISISTIFTHEIPSFGSVVIRDYRHIHGNETISLSLLTKAYFNLEYTYFPAALVMASHPPLNLMSLTADTDQNWPPSVCLCITFNF